jgi:tetratricopeptide (TPR) repeat protein
MWSRIVRFQDANLVIAAAIVLMAAPAALRAEDAADHLTSANAHLDQREYDKAIEDCDKAIDLDAESAEAYITRARAWAAKREYPKAVADCDEAISISPGLAAAYVARANAFMDNDDGVRRIADREKALADCNKALGIDPKSVAAFTARGRAWIYKHECDKAIADCDKALSLDPKSAETYDVRGNAWSDKRDFGKALSDLNQAVALNPKLAKAFFDRAWVFNWKGEDDNAAADFRRALAITPDDWNTLNNLGVQYWKLAQKQERLAAAAVAAGDLETAKSCRQKSVALKNDAKAQWIHGIKVSPKASDIHSNLGYAYSEAWVQADSPNEAKHYLDLAEHHLRAAVELKDISPRPHNNLGRVLLRQGQVQEIAANAAEIKSKTEPAEAAKVEQFRADAKAKLDEAIKQFEKAVQLDPSLLEARLNLGEVFTWRKEYDKAEAQYQAIGKFEVTLKTNPNNPDELANFSQAHFGLARIAVARKDSDEAIRHLERAVEVNPSNLPALRLLAVQQYQIHAYPAGEKSRAAWLAKMPVAARQQAAVQFVNQLDDAGFHEAAEEVRKAAKNAEPKSR